MRTLHAAQQHEGYADALLEIITEQILSNKHKNIAKENRVEYGAFNEALVVASKIVHNIITNAPTQDFNELLEHCAKLCENHWDVDSAAAEIRKLKQHGQ